MAIPAAIGIAAAGALGGKKKKKGVNFGDIQGQLAEKLFNQTDPLRQMLLNRSTNFLSSGDPRETPIYKNLQLTAGQGFNRAKDNTIARFAPGGALMEALTGLEGDRAQFLSQGASDIYSSEIDRALALGTGVTGQSLNALGQAGQLQAARAQANADRDAGKAGGIGAGLGALMGSK